MGPLLRRRQRVEHRAPLLEIERLRVGERFSHTGNHHRGHDVSLRGDVTQDVTHSCHDAVAPSDFVGETAKFQSLRSRMAYVRILPGVPVLPTSTW